MRVFVIQIHTMHNVPDFSALMFSFQKSSPYLGRKVSKFIVNDDNMLYAATDRTVFTQEELDRLIRLLNDYQTKHQEDTNLIGYIRSEVELPKKTVAAFATRKRSGKK